MTQVAKLLQPNVEGTFQTYELEIPQVILGLTEQIGHSEASPSSRCNENLTAEIKLDEGSSDPIGLM